MVATKIKKEQRNQTGKVIPGMTYKKATKIMWEAHSRGKATVKRCHKELAELYREQLRGEGLTVSLEPAG